MIHSLSQKILPQKSSHQSSYFYPSLTEKTNMTPRILPQKSSHQSSYFYPSLTEKTNMTPRVADDAIKINHN